VLRHVRHNACNVARSAVLWGSPPFLSTLFVRPPRLRLVTEESSSEVSSLLDGESWIGFLFWLLRRLSFLFAFDDLCDEL
jgi:hypothetical protein